MIQPKGPVLDMGFEFTPRQIEKIDAYFKARDNYECQDFYAASDQYRWGSPDSSGVDKALAELKVIFLAKLIEFVKGETHLAETLLDFFDIPAYCIRNFCRVEKAQKEKK